MAIIGSSEMYETEASRDNGIESGEKHFPDATVEDKALKVTLALFL